MNKHKFDIKYFPDIDTTVSGHFNLPGYSIKDFSFMSNGSVTGNWKGDFLDSSWNSVFFRVDFKYIVLNPLLVAPWDIFPAIFIVCWYFSKLKLFLKYFFWGFIRVSNCFDPDQSRH